MRRHWGTCPVPFQTGWGSGFVFYRRRHRMRVGVATGETKGLLIVAEDFAVLMHQAVLGSLI